MNTVTVINRLRAQLGESSLLTDTDSLARHAMDPRGRYTNHALDVARPGSTQEWARVIAACREHTALLLFPGAVAPVWSVAHR